MDVQKRTLLAIVISIFIFHPIQSHSGVWDQVKSKSYEITQKAVGLFKSDENSALEKMGELQDYSAEYLDLKNQERRAPVKSLFGKTKDDYRKSAEEILEEVETILFNEEIMEL